MSSQRRQGGSPTPLSSAKRQPNKTRSNSVIKSAPLAKAFGEISKLPKLRIESPIIGQPEEICDIGQAKDKLRFDSGILVVTDGQWVGSYDELVRLITQDSYRNKEVLDIKIVPIVGGG